MKQCFSVRGYMKGSLVKKKLQWEVEVLGGGGNLLRVYFLKSTFLLPKCLWTFHPGQHFFPENFRAFNCVPAFAEAISTPLPVFDQE